MIFIDAYKFRTSTAFLTGSPSGSLRNDLSFELGLKLTVGGTGKTITHLGRWVVSGNSGSHIIRVYAADGSTVLASATLNTSGLSVGYQYVALGTPLALSASTVYYILSQETASGDQWYDVLTYSNTGIGSIVAAFRNGGAPTSGSTSNESYVPINFKYY